MTAVPSVVIGRERAPRPWQRQSALLLAAGLAAFAVAAAVYVARILSQPMADWMEPVDLRVYRLGVLMAAHVAPWYNPARSSPLYDWPGYGHLKFTYTPFSALIFTVLRPPPLHVLFALSIAVNVVALIAAIWVTLGGAGFRAGAARLGATLLVAAAVFWTEPVQRTL